MGIIHSKGPLIWLAVGLLSAVGLAANGADGDGGGVAAAATGPTASDQSAAEVMYLGDIKITGQKVIVAALQQIKAALHRPIDTSRARENDIVCRISSNTGFREHQYLICASNRQFNEMRFQAQNHVLEARSMVGGMGKTEADNQVILLQHLTAENPNHVLRMPIDASKFGALLQTIPDAAPQAASNAGDSGH